MSLRSLSDKALVAQLSNLVRRERETTFEILQHLGEIERRKIHFRLGYRSLFAYCTEHLGYSSSGAGRRVAVARCIRRFPSAAHMLQSGHVNLTSLAMIAGSLTDENANALLARIAGRRQQEVEAVVAEIHPVPRLRDRVKPICVRVPMEKPAVGAASKANDGDRSVTVLDAEQPRDRVQSPNHSHNGSDSSAATTRTIEKMQLQFAAGADFMAKLERVQSLLSSKHPRGLSFEQVFEMTMDAFLDKHDPVARAERRQKRGDRTKKKTLECSPANSGKSDKQHGGDAEERDNTQHRRPARAPAHVSGKSRRISSRVRDAVYKRDGGRCTYKGATGKRCGSRHNLHVDHVVPHANGGSNALSNLRLLCAHHNRLEAERIMGSAAQRYTRRE